MVFSSLPPSICKSCNINRKHLGIMSCFLVILLLIVDKTLSETKRIRFWPGWNECYKSRLPERDMRKD